MDFIDVGKTSNALQVNFYKIGGNIDSVKAYLVTNSKWEYGEDILEITQSYHNGIFLINKQQLTFDELTTGNYHIEIRNLKGGLIFEENCGINSRKNNELYYFDGYSSNYYFGVKSIGNGAAYETNWMLDSTINCQLISGSIDNPGEVLINDFGNTFIGKYGLGVWNYSIEEIRNMDVHVKCFLKSDSSLVNQCNIGINAP